MLEGKISLVTGASSGLGYQFAQTLVRQGSTVAVAARTVSKLDDLVALIEKNGGKAAAFQFNASDPSASDTLMDAVQDRLGPVDILVNNAGISMPDRAENATLEAFEQTMAINVRAPWQLSQLCARAWLGAGKEGCIVNVSSMLAKRAGRGVSLYCMSKAAISHLTACHATEWAQHGIRVNAICPGYVKTSINADFWETSHGKAELARLPRRRVGEPSDLDGALLFLVDPRNHFVNGECLTVDDAQSWAI